LSDPEIAAIAVATEAPEHFEIASAALAAGKHVFVEKPMALSSADCRALIAQASAAGRKLMVGHLLEHHPAFDAIRGLIVSGEIGDIHYMYTQRLNLGIVRGHENAWWSLAPHDISVICRLFDAEPVSVAAQGQSYLQKQIAGAPRDVEDVVFATLRFADGRMAGIHVSWLDPHKTRQMTIVGTRKMITWDDMAAGEKVRIYDKAAVTPHVASYAEAITLRTGDILIPKIDSAEPLAREVQHFVEACLDDKPVFTDGEDGLRVVRVLAAGQKSLEGGGSPVPLNVDT
jgi:predicted dehydrogenase